MIICPGPSCKDLEHEVLGVARHSETEEEFVVYRASHGEAAPSIRPGRYRHYKGQHYEVLGVGRHSKTEEELVVYRALCAEGGLWIRPVSMFVENVDLHGRQVPRFSLLDERAEAE